MERDALLQRSREELPDLVLAVNILSEGLDLVIEGDAAQVSDETKLQLIAETYASKYDAPFRFTVRDGAFAGEGGNRALVYEVTPITAFGFGKGEPFSQTRWRF